MIFYNLLFAFLVLLRYGLKGQGRGRVKVYLLLLVALFLFSAFRFKVGCDWYGYWNQWLVVETAALKEGGLKEPTWWGMIAAIQSLGLSYPWLNVASSLLFFGGVHVLARRQPDPLGFLILLFPILIINLPMSGIRQASAIGVMCLAFVAFIDKRLLRFIAWTALAGTMHNSAIVFILLAPLVGGNYTKKRLLLAALLALPGVAVLLSGSAAEVATSRYIGTSADAAGAIFRVGLLMLTGVIYFAILRKPWKQTFPKDYKLVSVGALIMCLMIALVPLSSVIGDRLGYYLVPLQAMIFARIPYLPLRHTKSLYTVAPYLGLGFVFFVWTVLSGVFTPCYVPYQSWIFGFPGPYATN